MHRSGSVALNLNRRPNRRPIWPRCRNQNETVALFCEVNAERWCLLAEPSPCGGTSNHLKIRKIMCVQWVGPLFGVAFGTSRSCFLRDLSQMGLPGA